MIREEHSLKECFFTIMLYFNVKDTFWLRIFNTAKSRNHYTYYYINSSDFHVECIAEYVFPHLNVIVITSYFV